MFFDDSTNYLFVSMRRDFSPIGGPRIWHSRTEMIRLISKSAFQDNRTENFAQMNTHYYPDPVRLQW